MGMSAYVKMPTIEEADAMEPGRQALEALAETVCASFAKEMERLPRDGDDDSVRRYRAIKTMEAQRMYDELSKPIVDHMVTLSFMMPMVLMKVDD
jgi:hypothetical protein